MAFRQLDDEYFYYPGDHVMTERQAMTDFTDTPENHDGMWEKALEDAIMHYWTRVQRREPVNEKLLARMSLYLSDAIVLNSRNRGGA